MNRLYYGDCLTIMRDMPLESVDLIYLDPPFNSKRDYHAIYKDETGRPLPDQIEAFCDQWTLDEERERAIRQIPVLMRKAGVEDGMAEFWRTWMNALRLTQPILLAYLSYMVERLLPMRRLLRPSGSIYLHCDPTASHYIKVMMDGIFGHKNFRNEIIWRYKKWENSPSCFQKNHDVILFYSKSSNSVFNAQYGSFSERQKQLRKAGYNLGSTSSGEPIVRIYDESNPKVIDRRGVWEKEGRRIYIVSESKGKAVDSVWDISAINTNSKERMGYRTQKPLSLLERIIKASTNEGDVVLDPFCGCATTMEAAQRLNRQWIGIDIAIHAIKRVAAVRLGERCHLKQGIDFEMSGIPRTLGGARDLWERDKYHFQKWAVEEVDGFVTARRTADGGIDGRLYFDMPGKPDLQSMVLEVKGGKNITIADFRALHSVLEREEALMAGLITMFPLPERQKANFLKLAAEAGDLEVPGSARDYPRLQILSVPEILEGKRFQTPTPMGKKQSAQSALQLRP